MIEKRRYPRFEIMMPATYSVVDQRDIKKPCFAKNISAEGLCFESNEELKPGSYVNLEVDLGDKDNPVFIVGEIKWSIQAKNESSKEMRYSNGVKLLEVPMSDEGRFLKYYCDKMIQKLANYLKM